FLKAPGRRNWQHDWLPWLKSPTAKTIRWARRRRSKKVSSSYGFPLFSRAWDSDRMIFALVLEQMRAWTPALQQGSEEPTTFLNLATALGNLGRTAEAQAVLERGVAAYPYSGPLVARLAQEYFLAGQAWRARDLVQQYRTLFPEDPALREVQKVLDAAAASGPAPGADRGAPVAPPR